MKKVLIGMMALFATSTFAFDKGLVWNSGYTIATVRANAGGWLGFTVVPKNTTTSGNTITDAGQFFVVSENSSHYKSMSAAIFTAKSLGKTISFCVCNTPVTGGVLWDLSVAGGIDIDP